MENIIISWDYLVYLPIVFHLMLGVATSYCFRHQESGAVSVFKDNDIERVLGQLVALHVCFWLIISVYLCFMVDVDNGVMYFVFGWLIGNQLEENILNSKLSTVILIQYKLIAVAQIVSILLLVCLWYFK